jgi:hypothetical protein
MSVDDAHARPSGTSDATVAAVGKVSEALEVIEDARGQLFNFHRKIGMADLALGEAVQMLRDAGHREVADRLDTDLVGRNILAGRWTFQIIEEFEDGYYAAFKEHERAVREQLMDGRRHVFEAEMKQNRRTHGRPGHDATPSDVGEGPPR